MSNMKIRNKETVLAVLRHADGTVKRIEPYQKKRFPFWLLKLFVGLTAGTALLWALWR